MKILWISSWFGDYRVPVYDNLNRLSDGNFYLICSESEISESVKAKLRCKLEDHAILLKNQHITRLNKSGSDYANSNIEFRWQSGLYLAIKQINPDIIIVEGFGRWAPAGVLYAKRHNIPLLMFYERTKWTERNAGCLRSFYRKWIGKAVDCFLTNGCQSEEYLRDILEFKDTPIVKGCMSSDFFENPTIRNHFSKGLTYMFAGRLVEPKGICELLLAWKEHFESYHDDKLIIVGTGVLYDKLRTEYQGLGIIWKGYVDYDGMHELYDDCDVVVMPTLEDNWSLVVPEAMSCKRPVLCSKYNGGCPELIHEGINGYIFDPLNHEEFVRILAKCHISDLTKMGENAYNIVADYSHDKSSKRIFDACCSCYNKI